MSQVPDTRSVPGQPALPATALHAVTSSPAGSPWHQPRDAAGAYIDIGRRALPALTSLRFFAALYVVVHHLINISLLSTQGADADRSATWYLAWGTQGHVGVTFFFVLSGFILAWCYHRAFAAPASDRREARTSRRFYVARFARVWPLHAAMLLAFVPLAIASAGLSIAGLWTTAWQGVLNATLLHAWIPWGGPDGLSDTFNAPSWTLSCEALFYVAFPAIATLLVHRLRWGWGQLALLIVAAWGVLGVLGVAATASSHGEWIMRVLPATRIFDFVIGVAIGLIVVQWSQQHVAHGQAPRREHASMRWSMLEVGTLLALCLSPLVWATGATRVLPDTLGVSWFHLPVIAAVILLMALERGSISRRVLAARSLVWLGEISYALYLVHLFILLAAYRVGAFSMLGPWLASALLVAVSIGVAAVVHVRFEQPARARIAARLSS